MESHTAEVEMGMGGSSGTPSGSRWNPRKEQISILENLYNQGIRTPNADQIQHLATQLRAYGHVEGKNVFYWFQNHKARQRQKLKLKQKQQGTACFNRFTPTPQPIFSSPLCQNGVYWLQQNGVTFYPQQPKVLVDGVISPTTEKVVSLGMPRICDGPQMHEQLQQGIPDHNFRPSNQETLTLFPLHPTGIDLEGKTIDQLHSRDSISVDSSIDTSGSAHVDEDDRADNKPFFDFFSPLYKGLE